MRVLWTICRVTVRPAPFRPHRPSRWDIFCRVIDNHGDLGVCWRLSADLAQRGHTVRLWVDDASALRWMAPQGQAGVTVHPWPDHSMHGVTQPGTRNHHNDHNAADTVIEAFGCELPEHVQASISHHSQERLSRGEPPVRWINLEYLSAEGYVARQHGLPSPVMSGPAKGCTKYFFFPGFTENTGGLLREPGLMARQHSFDREAWRRSHVTPSTQPADASFKSTVTSPQPHLISLFCYEPKVLPQLLQHLTRQQDRLLVTPGRPLAAVQQALAVTPEAKGLTWQELPHTDQTGFDHMLWACDLNFVRGEDSLVRALWAGQPLVWHIYPQDDNAHHAKLTAFLDWLEAPPSLRHFHAVWNGVSQDPLPAFDAQTLADWAACVRAAREKLLRQDDLVTQLEAFQLAQAD
jgi:uncharacterized repeat protein (TIGR03837 family)